jgi:hypothetical protein
MSSYVPDDGFTESGYLKAVPRLHEALRFKFRPCLVQESSRYFQEAANLGPEEADRKAAELIASKLVSWDLHYPSNKTGTVPVSPESVLRLKRRLFQRLLEIIVGLAAPDDDPNGDPQERADHRADVAEATKEALPFRDRPAKAAAAPVGGGN